MVYQLKWTPRSRSSLAEIRDAIAKDNPAAAKKMIAGIRKRCQLLRTVPLIGSFYEREPSGRTRQIVYKSYRIFYRIIESLKQAEVLLVWHNSRQEPNLPFIENN